MAYTNNSVYWIGADQNVYVKNGSGVTNYGRAIGYGSADPTGKNGIETARGSVGATRIDDPNAPRTSVAGGGGYSSGGGGGGGSIAAAPTVDPAVLSYYDTLIGNAQSSLARADTQRSVGIGNIESSYNSGLNDLTESKAIADRDLGLARAKDIQGNIDARGKINTNVGNAITSGQRLLGAAGAGRSSAASTLLPFAVAKQGTDEQRAVQEGFSYNQQGFDTKAGDQQREFDKNKTALGNDRQNKLNALEAGIQQSNAQIQQQIQGYQAQKAQAQGKSYADTQAITTPYTNAINAALDSAARLGAQSTVAPVGQVKYTAPDLKTYDPTQITAGTVGETGVQQQTAPYFSLLANGQKDKDKGLVAA